jgi:putative ABC transport system permease protein
MLAVVLSAIRRRPAQAVLLVVLGFVASAGAAAAPWYVAAGAQSLAESAARSAPAGERVVAVDGTVSLGPGASSAAAERATGTIRSEMVLTGFDRIADVRLRGRVEGTNATLAYRERACDMVHVLGRCPSAAGEVAVDADLADRIGAGVGDPIALVLSQPDKPLRLTAVGIFRARSPYDAYWGRSAATGERPAIGDRLPEGLLLTPLATFDAIPVATPVAYAVDFIATPQSFRDTDPQQLLLAFLHGRDALANDGVKVSSDLSKLTDRVWFDQQVMVLGVPLGAAQLMVLCWFALFLAVRQMGEERRGDVARLKLRGVRRRDLWLTMAGQSVLPLLIGGAAGLVAGPILARWAVGEVRVDQMSRLAEYAGIGGAALAVLGAVLAALVAERRMIKQPVAELDRRVLGRRRRWRSGAIDAVIVTAALAAGYQLWRAGASNQEVRGLATAAPVLVALAAGLLAARSVPVVAAALAPTLLAARRLGAWLVAVNLARRSGHSPVLALLTVAVAVFLAGVVNWDVSAAARGERAVVEVGADRVLSVEAPSRAALVAAVRSADPDGRYAMAAVQTYGTLPFLALDATRLAAVVPWRAGYGGPAWSEVARAIRPPVPEPVVLAGTSVRLTATWNPRDGAADTRVAVRFVTAAGQTEVAGLGPLRAGRHEYAGDTPGCGPERACRLVSIGLTGTGEPPPEGSTLVLHALTQSGPEIELVPVGGFRDRVRWRNDVEPGARTTILSTVEDGLALRVAAPPADGGSTWPAAVFAYDAPVPLPAVAVGKLPPIGAVGSERAAPFGGAAAPVRVVGRADLLPRLGSTGLLADLDYADRLLAGEPTVGTMQVWLGRDAPAVILQRLAAAGVTVIATDAVGDRLGSLANHGPPLTLQFLVLAAAAGVLLATGSFAVWMAVDGGPRAVELAALRRHGLSAGTVRAATLGGYLAVVAAVAVVGTALAAVVYALARPAVFADGWSALTPPPPRPSAALLAFGLALGPLAVTAVIGGVAMLRGTRFSREAR